MRRARHELAIAAVVLGLSPTGCNKEEAKKAEETPAQTKPADPPAAEPTQPSQAGAAAPSAPGSAEPVNPGVAPPPGMGHAPTSMDPGKRPASITDKHLAVADKVVEAAHRFAMDLEATKGNCKQAAGVVKVGGPSLAKAMDDTEKLQSELNHDQQALEWLSRTYGPKMMVELQRFGPIIQNCLSDKDFEAAYKSLQMGRERAQTPPPAPPAQPAPTK